MDDPMRPDRDLKLERLVRQRSRLEAKHSRGLAKLMSERSDLQGVHALADLVADSLRWSA